MCPSHTSCCGAISMTALAKATWEGGRGQTREGGAPRRLKQLAWRTPGSPRGVDERSPRARRSTTVPSCVACTAMGSASGGLGGLRRRRRSLNASCPSIRTTTKARASAGMRCAQAGVGRRCSGARKRPPLGVAAAIEATLQGRGANVRRGLAGWPLVASSGVWTSEHMGGAEARMREAKGASRDVILPSIIRVVRSRRPRAG